MSTHLRSLSGVWWTLPFGQDRRAEYGGWRLRTRLRFLGRVQQPPPQQLWGPEELCELPGGVRGGVPTAQRFSTILSTQGGLSRHYNIVIIADYHASVWRGAIRPSHACVRPRPQFNHWTHRSLSSVSLSLSWSRLENQATKIIAPQVTVEHI